MEKEGREFFLRKLHSFCGLIPLAIFLTFHMLMNSSVLRGPEAYNLACYFMTTLLPFKDLLEWAVIYLPLLFHGILGVWIALKAKNNVGRYHYARNWAFYLQRLTGIILIFFIIWHLWTTRIQVNFGVEPNFDTMAAIVANPFGLAFMIIGIVCGIYHLSNGIWTWLITWGILVSPKSQKVARYVVNIFFVCFACYGLITILAFTAI